ncbi:hypothetical protein CBF90_06625 [Microbacterium sp. AISO3]|uniref:hypothetical protein n=1 Tax=Microbacterium sp. AISO3 TaxID=2002831 RepID=UPI000B4DA1F5|nr:hypothetical protein [Microbacterium sp. AISO3]OWP22568.1 hypothetical protein CBF90_06625 [Microbacterium sp. AISO3]
MDLNDQLTPNEHGDLRDRIIAGAGRMSATRARRSHLVAGAAAVVLVGGVISGVAFATARSDHRIATPVETATPVPPSPTPPSTPTPTPTSPPTTPSPPAPSPPAAALQVANGDCEAVLPADSLSDAVESDAQFMADDSAAGDVTLATLGGLYCRYAVNSGMMELVVLPAEAAADGVVDEFGADDCHDREVGRFCYRVSAGERFWAIVASSSPQDSGSDSSDLLPILERVDGSLAMLPSAHAVPPTRQWRTPIACSDADTAELAQVVGASLTVEPGTGWPANLHTAIANAAHREASCLWYTADGLTAFSITVRPGAGPVWADAASSAGAGTPVEVAGATDARVGASASGDEAVVATDGVNLIEVRGRGADLASVASAYLMRLG